MRRLGLLWIVSVVAVGAFVGNATASSLVPCQHIRGYYNVRVRNVGCKRAGQVLWRAREGSGNSQQIQGWTCATHGHGPGGGFPVEMVCTRRRAVARGWVFDGPA